MPSGELTRCCRIRPDRTARILRADVGLQTDAGVLVIRSTSLLLAALAEDKRRSRSSKALSPPDAHLQR